MDPFPDPLLLRKSGRAGIEPKTSGLAAKNSDHYITEAVTMSMSYSNYLFYFYLLLNLSLS
jgi:hypothetical protein